MQPALARRRRDPRRLVGRRLGQLECEHRAETADVARPRAPSSVSRRRTWSPISLRPRAQLRQRIEHGERRSARDRVAGEGAAQPAGWYRVHHLGATRHRREWQAPAERLAADEQVGLRVVVLDRPDRPGAAAARLHLVVHVEDPVLVEQLLQALREVGRHRDEAALALHGLEHRARDRLRVDVALEEMLQPLDRVVGADAPVRVRGGRAVDLGRERPEALLVRDDLRGHRHRRAASGRGSALSKTMTAGRPVATRAILTAFSIASAPEFSSSDFWSSPRQGDSSASRRQTSTYGSYMPTIAHWCR